MPELQLTPQHLLIRQATGVEDPDLRDLLGRSADVLDGLIEAYSDNVADAARSRRFSPVGLREHRQSVGRLALEAIESAVGKPLENLRTGIEREQAQLLGQPFRHALPPGSDPDDERLREAETRQLLRQLEPGEAEAAYLRAAAAGDWSMCRAVELAPAAFPLASPEAQAQAAAAYAEAVEPARWNLLQEQITVADHIESNCRQARSRLEKLGFVDAPPEPMPAEAA